MTEQTKFTVVIPTRERCRYLESALRTCVTHDYDNFEILVSDNLSQDDTKAVVDSFRSDRIRYVNTGRRCSMTDNWEFALSHVKDGYVLFIGDDDGLLPGGLRSVDDVIRRTGAQIVIQDLARYTWPDHPIPESRNILRVTFRRPAIERIRSADAMRDVVLSHRRSITNLPTVYHGVVKMALIDEIRAKAKLFFHSMCPDICSGIVNAVMTDHFHFTTTPFTVGGVSGASTGHSSRVRGTEFENPTSQKPVELFMQEETRSFHPKLVSIRGYHAILAADALLQLQEHLPEARRFELDLKAVMKAVVEKAQEKPHVPFLEGLEAVREIGRKNGLDAYAEQLIAKATNRPVSMKRPVPGIAGKKLILDCADFGVTNVYEASLLYKHAVTLREKGYFSLAGSSQAAFGKVRRKINKFLGRRS